MEDEMPELIDTLVALRVKLGDEALDGDEVGAAARAEDEASAAAAASTE